MADKTHVRGLVPEVNQLNQSLGPSLLLCPFFSDTSFLSSGARELMAKAPLQELLSSCPIVLSADCAIKK